MNFNELFATCWAVYYKYVSLFLLRQNYNLKCVLHEFFNKVTTVFHRKKND